MMAEIDEATIAAQQEGGNALSSNSRLWLMREVKRVILENAALVFADDDPGRVEGFLEHRKRPARLCAAAHEHIERRIAAFRPCMHADMALGEDGNARYATAFREPVQMYVQERRTCGTYCIDQRLFDPIAVVEILGVPQIDDQVTARI